MQFKKILGKTFKWYVGFIADLHVLSGPCSRSGAVTNIEHILFFFRLGQKKAMHEKWH